MDVNLTAMQQTIIASVLIPVIMAFFRKEISNFLTDLSTYRNRRFDNDGDPGIGCECYLQSKATGKFKKILVFDYTFHIYSTKRNVITVQDAPDGEGVIIVPYTYSQWRDLIKGSLSKRKRDVIRSIPKP